MTLRIHCVIHSTVFLFARNLGQAHLLTFLAELVKIIPWHKYHKMFKPIFETSFMHLRRLQSFVTYPNCTLTGCMGLLLLYLYLTELNTVFYTLEQIHPSLLPPNLSLYSYTRKISYALFWKGFVFLNLDVSSKTK